MLYKASLMSLFSSADRLAQRLQVFYFINVVLASSLFSSTLISFPFRKARIDFTFLANSASQAQPCAVVEKSNVDVDINDIPEASRIAVMPDAVAEGEESCVAMAQPHTCTRVGLSAELLLA